MLVPGLETDIIAPNLAVEAKDIDEELKVTVIVNVVEHPDTFEFEHEVFSKTFDEAEPISNILDFVHSVTHESTSAVNVSLTVDGQIWQRISRLDDFTRAILERQRDEQANQSEQPES